MNADIVIVGGGIAGLYAAYRLLQTAAAPPSIILLEKDKRLGGRAGTARFRGVDIVTGAGIGRVEKDVLLAGLMRELGLEVNSWPMRGSLKGGPLRKLRAALSPESVRETFEDYGKRILGAEEFSQWIAAIGYTDLMRANARDTVLNYGLEDFVTSAKRNGFTVPWGDLVAQLYAAVKNKITIVRDCEASAIDQNARKIKTSHGTFKWHHKLIIATDINGIRTLLPNYKHIRGQPFSRVYAQFAEGPGPALPIDELTVVGGVLQKVIPIDVKKRVYMIAYNDNAATNELYNSGHFLDKKYYQKELTRIFGVKVPAIKYLKTFYWPIGTHYTEPHVPSKENLLNPRPGIFVVGEAVSKHQGWTEGAFETVEAMLKK